MSYHLTKDLLMIQKNHQDVSVSMYNSFLQSYCHFLSQLSNKRLLMECLSSLNRIEHEKTAGQYNYNQLKVGDVCYIDFGHAYLYEAGYQHFGIITKIAHYKLFVVPLTSNNHAQKESDYTMSPHLFYFGWIAGLTKQSVGFLNDAKFISCARVIDVKGHLPEDSDLFLKLKRRLAETIL